MKEARQNYARSIDVASFFNPAYCAALLHSASSGYEKKAGKGMPYTLAFIALPLLLYSDFVRQIPSGKSKLLRWLSKNPELVSKFPTRAKQCAPFCRAAIIFGCSQKILKVDAEMRIHAVVAQKAMATWRKGSAADDAYRSGSVVGRLIADGVNEPTVFTALGVRP